MTEYDWTHDSDPKLPGASEYENKIKCVYCTEMVDIDGEDATYSWIMDTTVHRDCLIDCED